MEKNKLYIFLSILTIVFLFSFSAVCNQCAAAAEEEKTDVEEEVTEEETTEEESTKSEEETTEEETEEEAEEEEIAEEDMEEPTIDLEVDEGPLYSSEDDVCFWRVKANVSGNPTPDIEWNKDDSLGRFGNTIAQVNLHDPGETFTLTATATNSKGEATDSIELSWECDGEEVADTDEDGDGNGDEDSEAEEYTIYADTDISGYMYYSDDIHDYEIEYSNIAMGDSDEDYQAKGYCSFYISGLHGKTVQDAEINFTFIGTVNNPGGFASNFAVDVFNYVRLDATDFDRPGGVHLVDIPISADSYTISGDILKNELQDVLDNEVRDYFQLRLYLDGETDGNGDWDWIFINCDNAILTINYTD